MIESYPLVTTLVASVTIAFVLGLMANRLHLPTILGYLLAGILIGPNTPGFIVNTNIAEQLAEVGVILLMFGVGLHFSTDELKRVHLVALPGAIIQMVITTFLCLSVAILLHHNFIESLVFGITLSVASTVVLLRTLEEHKMMNSPVGKIAIGWLIVEDIAVVVILVLIPAFWEISAKNQSIDIYSIFRAIGLVLVKISVFIVIMMVFGKKLLPKFLVTIVKTKSRELMALGIIAISSGFAFIAYTIFGASFALGAFMAGFVLNESKIGRKAAEKTLLLRDIFAVLFFVSAGMLFNPLVIIEEPILILVAFILVTFGKAAIARFIMKIFRQPISDCVILSVSLAQIGEFSFILAAVALKLNIFSHLIYDMVIASAIMSIAINPFLFKLAKKYYTKQLPA